MPQRRYDFLVDTYRTERLKTLSVWSQVPDGRMRWRPEPRGRSPLEHMVHQCVSEDAWMRTMLGVDIGVAALPADESRVAILRHYAACAQARHAVLAAQPDDWFEQRAAFFETERSRAWILTRRIAHTAHHRGQLTAYVRSWGDALYSTYGPTADTGGLPKDGARVIYRYDSDGALLGDAERGTDGAVLPPRSERAVTERPD